MAAVSIIFPHQLFKSNPCIKSGQTVYLVEEQLFFKQYNFHKQKIAFHRASMKFYATYLEQKKLKVVYVDSQQANSDIRKLIAHLHKNRITEIWFTEVSDNWLNKRIRETSDRFNISLKEFESQLFINTMDEINSYFINRKNYFQTEFYINQRKKRKILLNADNNPKGGKWSFDVENRAKFPKNESAPLVLFPEKNSFTTEAKKYVETHFPNNHGQLQSGWNYPVNYIEAEEWLEQFFEKRFTLFGKYEDALVMNENIIHHSVLSPMLNTGLIDPGQLIEKAIHYAEENNIPVNSLEGFVRQILGWREFIRAMYELKGTSERTKNFWGFTRKIPMAFWEGTTGILPVDNVIKKVLKTGYAHHIERLMVLGNFMMLCEFSPNEVYQWFMELFIDSYDWVMVPNVYGMSQFADGGLFATKPYISGSNYLMKMGDYEKGQWQHIWDGLFWRFIHVHRDFFQTNPRLGMMVKMFDKMPLDKQKTHLENANHFLERIK